MIRSGLDVNGDGQLTLASMDRVSDSDTVSEKDTNGHWWRKSVSTVYPADNAATAVVVSTYYDDGKLATRTWARTTGPVASPEPSVTTYSYASDA